MRTKRDCTRCDCLHQCKEVSTRRLIDGHTCNDWRRAPDHELEAREQVIQEFGPAALRYALTDEHNSAGPRRRK